MVVKFVAVTTSEAHFLMDRLHILGRHLDHFSVVGNQPVDLSFYIGGLGIDAGCDPV